MPERETGLRPSIFYISEELFNTNPSDVEYFMCYVDTNYVSNCRVFDENGTILFSKDSSTWSYSVNFSDQQFIAFTTMGAKMILYGDPLVSANSKNAFVYSLPGSIPCQDCTNGTISSIMTNNNGANEGKISNYPNPTLGQVTVEYTLPQGINKADLVFYNTTGQEVKRYKVTNAFHNIIINTADLNAGTYYYQLQSADGIIAGKKMVVLK